jgi:GR25 family glycosyltransferase involved in LPS biosynthesis
MHCIYINLDSQIERRQFVEQNFAKFMPSGWTLHRYSAFDASRKAELPEGKLRDSEKACFLSHVGALEQALTLPGNEVLILEDDVYFGPNSARLISEALSMVPPALEVLFTDVCVIAPEDMVNLFLLRRTYEQERTVKLLNLSKIVFAGATAYLVRKSSCAKLIRALKNLPRLDLPYDLVLRQWIAQHQLSAYAIFPFATSLSYYADSSQIQPKESEINEICWNAFRRLVCVDASMECGQALRTIYQSHPEFVDPAARMFGEIMGLRLSGKFKKK